MKKSIISNGAALLDIFESRLFCHRNENGSVFHLLRLLTSPLVTFRIKHVTLLHSGPSEFRTGSKTAGLAQTAASITRITQPKEEKTFTLSEVAQGVFFLSLSSFKPSGKQGYRVLCFSKQ